MLLIGVDVGGTFTDVVFTDTERNRTLTHKLPSTPDDPSRAVMRGVKEICGSADVAVGAVQHIYHGTTVATNAALTHRGSRAGMITTRGFRDIVHIGRHQRPHHYSIQQSIPWQDRPLVQRRYRKVVDERISVPNGEVVVPLAEEQVRQAARELRDAGVKAVAICFLFSFVNPSHEKRAKAIVQDECPDLFVTCSHEVSPQFREFERFTTTAMNAFIGPLVRDYVGRLAKGLAGEGFKGEVHIMRSNGGVAPSRAIVELPVYTLMSGLAAGVLGGAWVGELAGRRNVITLDIGGTSADIGVVTDGRFGEASARDTYVADYPILVPMIDLHTIGAGGGSIAYLDAGGAFRVGPQSAGAVPGPAAYGQGGTDATVTDANIVLGRLDVKSFLGGDMALDAGAARTAVQALAERVGLPLREAAEGIVTILNANMANAIRARTVQKGIDPREYALVAAGGAGPLHGAEVAQMLGIPEVIVPPHPGITSAIGLLTTDLKYDMVRTSFAVSTHIDAAQLTSDLDSMEASLRAQLASEGIDPGEANYERSADARYVGQGYELRLSLPAGQIDDASMAAALADFHRLHTQEYGHHFEQSPIELVNLRLSAIASVPKIGAPAKPAAGSLAEARLRSAAVVFRDGGVLGEFDTTFYDRNKLPAGCRFDGPAIVLQTDSTTVVPPRCVAQVHDSGAIIISLPRAGRAH
ncbi:MAG: hydantoinase/oxoprolinase family protein [Steroidobacteraceae bacterium]